jgi:hypothetical protein
MKLYTYYRSQASVGHPRISGREISGAAAIAGRCAGAGLGAWDRFDQVQRNAHAEASSWLIRCKV